MRQLFLFFIALTTIYMTSYAQELTNHQWEDRLLLVLSDSPANTTLRKQLEELRTHEKGLTERKLIIYHSFPTKYGTGLEYPLTWKESSHLFQEYNKEREVFKVVLIGLDGSVKLTQSTILSTEKLFETIDQMPMRRAEINKNVNTK